jgi:tetratricopeptide (TPR) repeat protein
VSRSLPYFRRAIELDPNFAEAYVGLATVDACAQVPSPEAEALIERALQLNSSLAEAHASSGLIKMFHHWDWRGAESELNKALELDSSSVSAHHWKGIYLSLQGRFSDAQAELHRALTLDPTSSILLADIGQLHYLSGDYDQAIEYCNQSLAIDPESQMPHLYLFDAYAAKGVQTEALTHFVMFELGDADSERRKKVLDYNLRIGLTQALKQKLAEYLGKGEEQQTTLALEIARIYLRLKNYDQALPWLERATERPNFFLPYVAVDPIYDPLRSNPRFLGIVKKLGLS